MQIYSFGWIGLPIAIYFIIKKYHLHSGELWLLVYSILLMASTIFGGWVMQLTHLIIITAISIHVLLMSKQTSGFIPQKQIHSIAKFIFNLQQELNIFMYILSVWLILRVYTYKSTSYGIGKQYDDGTTYQGVNQTLSGWDCTQGQFVIVPFLWVLLNSISYIIAKYIMRRQKNKDNLYKQFLIKYKVRPDIIFSCITFFYNLYCYSQTNSLIQCAQYWKYGYLMQLSTFYGFSFSTLYLFYVKKGIFLIQEQENNTNKSQNDDWSFKNNEL